MFRFKSSYLTLILVFVLLVTVLPLSAVAAASVQVKLNGSTIKFDGTQPQLINGSTMVPYRTLAEKLDAKVSYSNNKVVVNKGSKTVSLTIGSKTATVNGKSVALDAAPIVVKGSTLVPLRFLGESLDVWVAWNGASKTVSLETTKTITHAMGKTKLTKVPQRVVILFNGMVDISVTLGVKPVGAVESWVEKPFYKYLRPQLSGTKVLGAETQPNMEAIVALKPDLIIGSKIRHEKIYSQLSAIAPTIMTEEVFSWKSNMNLAAEALNKQQVASKFLANWDAKVADFKRQIGSTAKNTEVSIVRFQPDGSARFYVTGYAGTILEELGFSRPKVQQVPNKVVVTLSSKEQMKQLDGDIIFDITSDWLGDDAANKSQQEWTSNPLWNTLKGVKNDKYYKVNDITWNMSGGAMSAKKMLDDLYYYFDLE